MSYREVVQDHLEIANVSSGSISGGDHQFYIAQHLLLPLQVNKRKMFPIAANDALAPPPSSTVDINVVLRDESEPGRRCQEQETGVIKDSEGGRRETRMIKKEERVTEKRTVVVATNVRSICSQQQAKLRKSYIWS